MKTEALKRAQRKYRQKMRAQKRYSDVHVSFNFQRKKDADILDILSRAESKRGAVTSALREHWIVEGHLPKMKSEEEIQQAAEDEATD